MNNKIEIESYRFKSYNDVLPMATEATLFCKEFFKHDIPKLDILP
jgi:hypothetical protein